MALDPEIDNAQRFLDDAVRASASNVALSAGDGPMELEIGRWHLVFPKECRFKQGPDDVEVTPTTGNLALERERVCDIEVSGDTDRFVDVLTTIDDETCVVEASRIR